MDNKSRYISLLSSVSREGINELIAYLENTDFFIAPASTKYHLNKEGGLCEHSLNVYDNMINLRDMYLPKLSDETVIVVSLLHDISKIDFYETFIKNEKVYSTSGSKSDDLGHFDWVSSKKYKIKDPSNREFICGDHGVNSCIMAMRYINLTTSEQSAIINHHAGMGSSEPIQDLGEAMNRYPALTLLHVADLLSCYFNENEYMIDE